MPARLLQLTLFLAALQVLPCAGCAGASPASEDPAASRTIEPALRCESDTDCMVVPATCCGRCGAATSSDVRALRRDAITRGLARCTGSEDCPDCFAETSPRLYAVCREGGCEVVDETAEGP